LGPGRRLANAAALAALVALLVAVVAGFAASVTPGPALAVPTLLAEKRAALGEAERRAARLQDEIDRLTREYRAKETEIAHTEELAEKATADLEAAEEELAEKKGRLAQRVVGYYKERHASFPLLWQVVLGANEMSDVVKALPFVAKLADEDQRLVSEVRGLVLGLEEKGRELSRHRARLEAQRTELEQTRIELEAALIEAVLAWDHLRKETDALEAMHARVVEADRFRAGWRGRVPRDILELARNTAFPVVGPHSFINDWGFPRSDERTHEGTDVMAPFDAPLVAVAEGRIMRTAQGQPLGGTIVWLQGLNGIHYYYAHLSRIERGIEAGVRVQAGQVIGYVGDTGNAEGGAAHLHFQVHPGGGPPINPYPLLLVSSRVAG
jgi:peptidoglycan LD-endopeptidase LytH